MKLVKKYLTTDELVQIVDTLKTKETFIEKEIIKIGMVAQFCIDDFIENKEDLDCGEIYDLIVKDETNIYDDIVLGIKNYHVIDDIMSNEDGVVSLIKSFLEEVEEKIDNTENPALALSEAIEKLKELSDKNANI